MAWLDAEIETVLADLDPVEADARRRIVAEVRTWLGTPYHTNADIKGAGVDCGMIFIRVLVDLNLIEPYDPRPYPAQWAFHQRAELYLNVVQRFGYEVSAPPLPGDMVLCKVGKCWAHGAMVILWPEVIHANPPGVCRYDNWHQNFDLRKRPVRCFSLWPRS